MKKVVLNSLLAGLLLTPAAFAQDIVGKVIQIKTVKEGANKDLQYQRKDDKNWVAGYVDMQGRLHDRFKTDANTIAALEFLIGGRVGINKDSEIEIVSERSVTDAKKSVKRIVLKRGGMWAKAANLKEPLEIRTNGGVMGIKGTEFAIETQPGGDTQVAVLEGAVEVSDNNGKVIGQAKPGDKYTLPFKGAPVVKTYEPQALRQELEESSSWNDFNRALNIVSQLSSWAGYVPGTGALGQVGNYAWAASNLANVEQNPAGAVQAALSLAHSAGANTGVAGSIAGSVGGLFNNGGGRREPPKPDFPSNLSPDSSKDSKTERTAKALPVFSWNPVEGADGYVVLVCKDDKFDEIEWSARTKEGRVAYPSNARPLSSGRHFWRVFPVNEEDRPMDDKKGAQTFFDVVP